MAVLSDIDKAFAEQKNVAWLRQLLGLGVEKEKAIEETVEHFVHHNMARVRWDEGEREWENLECLYDEKDVEAAVRKYAALIGDEYKNIVAIIERGFNAINADYDLVYGYIDRLKAADPKKAAEVELMVLEQVPKDKSILQKMEQLRQTYYAPMSSDFKCNSYLCRVDKKTGLENPVLLASM
jgi:hypothetical protein